MIFSRRRLLAAAAAAVFTLAPVISFAQGRQPTPEQIKMMEKQAAAQKEKLFKDLGVTPAQRAKLTAIDKKYVPQIQKLQQQVMILYMQAQKETMAALTTEQKAKLKKMQQDQIAEMSRKQRK